jgi:hypothetical protein
MTPPLDKIVSGFPYSYPRRVQRSIAKYPPVMLHSLMALENFEKIPKLNVRI